MPLPSLSFILGVLVLTYLSTFVLFALLRIVTGVSVQRLTLSGLRRIAYSPRDGIRLEIRGLSIHIHRPTYSQPTWVSLVISELRVGVNLAQIKDHQQQTRNIVDSGSGEPEVSTQDNRADEQSKRDGGPTRPVKASSRAQAWDKLIRLKNRVKKLQRVIPWLTLVDVVAIKSSVTIKAVGTIHIGSLLLSVDTRRHAIDRSRLFFHAKTDREQTSPAEWSIALRSLLLTPAGRDSIEIVDTCMVNIHGFLSDRLEGLRDASVYVKLGRLHVPYDEFMEFLAETKRLSRAKSELQASVKSDASIKAAQSISGEEKEPEASTSEAITEAKDFVGSVLRGIKEVSVAVSLFGMSKRIDRIQPAGKPSYLSMSLKELGVDLYRLDPNTPAQSMYFSRHDIAHQALLGAISLSVGIDDGTDNPERLLYVPMSTAIVRTTLPSKLLQFATYNDLVDRNANVFNASLVITSPSIDLDPRHMPFLLALAKQRQASGPEAQSHSQRLFSRYLPKASLKLAVQEPVIRIALPTIEPASPDGFDFDLLISTASSVHLAVESSHAVEPSARYHLSADLKIDTQRLYYQTASKVRHNLVHNESLGLKCELFATPDVQVYVTVKLKTLSVFLIKAEITKGIRQIFRQIRTDSEVDKIHGKTNTYRPSFLRQVPSWLQHFEIEASDFNFEFAGLDKRLSDHPRGFALHIESWTVDYKIRKDELPRSPNTRRRGGSLSLARDADSRRSKSPMSRPAGKLGDTDGRRATIHIKGFEAFIIEAANSWEDEPFIAMPQTEIAMTTSSDQNGAIMHMQVILKSLYLQYALFKHYCIAVAIVMLEKTFNARESPVPTQNEKPRRQSETFDSSTKENSNPYSEFVVIAAKIGFVQIKAKFPSDPGMMVHMHQIEGSRQRWLNPFVKSHLLRLYVESPSRCIAWNRMVSVKNPRLDIRDARKKSQLSSSKTERSFDFVSDAVRIGVPHQMIVHKIFDNLVNTIKATAQLHHRFRTRSEEYILNKGPEGPRHVPRVSIRTHVLLFELEDGAFEWKLGVIYRTGLVEQRQRLAREEAFRLKTRSVRGVSKGAQTSRVRTTSTGSRDRTRRPASASVTSEDRDASRGRPTSSRSSRQTGEKSMRYDRDGLCDFTNSTQTSTIEARQKLLAYNSQSWKKRIDRALNDRHSQVAELQSLLWGLDVLPEECVHRETILKTPQRPALMAVIMSDVNVVIDKPTFPLTEMPDFLHRVGKGLPKDTLFSLLIPLHAHFEMGECRATLRDYPLPLIHIPVIKPGQSPRLPSWSLKTNFVIAEEYRDSESTRGFQVMVVPPEKMQPGTQRGGFAINVRRTVSPVKTYSEIQFDINTARDTRITWGNSYQPAIQDLMQVIEGFSKPQFDPSEKVGFWDKIRLSFHSRINVAWQGGGDVYLMLKGSRDPYVVTGYGAGFVMVWRNDVRLNIHQSDEAEKFMTVDSGDYVLAIPDYNHYARESPSLLSGQAAGVSSSSQALTGAYLKKVIMKLSGNVRWQAGIVFERNLPDGRRTFDFEPHYNVTLKNPANVKGMSDIPPSYDAFKGFRSNHLHLSIAIAAPVDRDWSNTELQPSSNYNSVHLSPRFFTHFFSWWSMFSGVMSLPIHQGSLYPNVDKSGKKFGRHIATLKYSLLFSPIFISHVYKHKEAEEYSSSADEVTLTGLKVRLDSFMLDLHQRREEFNSEVKGLNKVVKTSGMRIYQTLLDLVSADIRAVSASIMGTSQESLRGVSPSRLADPNRPVDINAFDIPDNDFSWIDIDDFVEVDWTLPENSSPQTRILPLAYAPRFTYRRQTDHHNTISGDMNRQSPFGAEQTHDCHIFSRSDSREVQLALIKSRLDFIEEIKADHQRATDEQELRVVRETQQKQGEQTRFDEMKRHGDILEAKKEFLITLQADLRHRLRDNELDAVADVNSLDSSVQADTQPFHPPKLQKRATAGSQAPALSNLVDPVTLGDHVSEFNNRFVAHNPKIKWTNALRNIMLRYMHQVSQRRGFVYYTSRRAVKFILDIVEEQRTKNTESTTPATQFSGVSESVSEMPMSPEDDEVEVADRIQQLLDDANKFVDADDSEPSDPTNVEDLTEEAGQHLARGFVAQNSYHVRLVAPQIQLQSQKNTKAAVLVTARGIRMKVYQIMDRDRVSDEISGLVQRRFAVELDNTQFFVTEKKDFSTDFRHMYSNNPYGASVVSEWPPWVPLEVMFDFQLSSFANHGFSQVVQKTSASLRYDKYNKLRLKYNNGVSEGAAGDSESQDGKHLQHAMDHLWIDFPQLRALCDSNQYFAMYIIVLDLLMYSEPLEKTRNEKLEKIMLASDFSDLRGAPELIIMLQDRIRQLEEIKTHFHINEDHLDRKGWEDRISMDQDLAGCENELFFMMKAITTSQRKGDERQEGSQVSGLLKWYLSAQEVVWHLTQDSTQPLAEFQLRHAAFERTDNSDGSNHNSVEINRIHGLNLLPQAIYPEILTAYNPKLAQKETSMLRVNWHMLEAIAGIPVVDTFEVNLFPLQVQLEYETGRRLFEYVFPGKGAGAPGDDGSSPFMVKRRPDQQAGEDNDDDQEEAMRRHYSIQAAAQQPSEVGVALGTATGAGSLEHRLMPTHRLPESKQVAPRLVSSSSTAKPKSGLGINLSEYDPRKMFQNFKPARALAMASPQSLSTKASDESFDSRARGRPIIKRSPATGEASGKSLILEPPSGVASEKKTRFAIQRSTRSSSSDSRNFKGHSNVSTQKSQSQSQSDDLSQMLSRASNFMTLAYVKIPSMVLCLSYKGRGNRNIEDVDSLVFRMPTLEYRNKTWSNLDLALALKKDIIRALISHTGTIIGNKFSHHKPGRQAQSRLRELSNSSALLSSNSHTELTQLAKSNTDRLRAIDSRVAKYSLDGTSSYDQSPRLSDVTDSDKYRYSHEGGGVSTGISSSYASSLAPTAEESPEYTEEYEHRPITRPQTAGSELDTFHDAHSPTSPTTHRDPLKNTFSRHFNDLTARASQRLSHLHPTESRPGVDPATFVPRSTSTAEDSSGRNGNGNGNAITSTQNGNASNGTLLGLGLGSSGSRSRVGSVVAIGDSRGNTDEKKADELGHTGPTPKRTGTFKKMIMKGVGGASGRTGTS